MKIDESQSEQILKFMMSGKSITPLDALNFFGCFRLGARIYDLKRRGLVIKTDMVCDNGKKYAAYSLVTLNKEQLKEGLYCDTCGCESGTTDRCVSCERKIQKLESEEKQKEFLEQEKAEEERLR